MAERGSRGGGVLVALVAFVILFFVAGVYAIVQMTEANKLRKSNDEMTKKFASAVTSANLSSPEMTQIKELQGNNAEARGQSAFDLLVKQRNDAVRLIIGRDPATSDTTGEANAAFAAAVKAANERLTGAKANATIPEGSASAVIAAMADVVAQKAQDVNSLTNQLAQANGNLKQVTDQYDASLNELRKSLETANSGSNQAQQASAAYRGEKDAQLAKIQQDLVATIEQGRKAAEELNTQLAGRNEEVNKLTRRLTEAVAALDAFRPKNVADAAVRRADGQVMQIAKGDTVYINLGTGDQITPGMTFQIYDRNEGIPRIELGAADDNLPPGKGSLEVVRVGAGSSEARIIRRAAGQSIQEGDMIANLIFDKNVKMAFKIFGAFDIDQNGVATTNEADILKRLVTQWGGQSTEEVGISTDFVVLGKEPVVGEKPADDQVIEIFNWQKAVKAKEEYDAVRNRALELHIPVLNQNRFLYLIGFYDQARR